MDACATRCHWHAPSRLQTGWKHLDLIKRLEAQRKEASAAFYAKKKEATRRVSAARAAAVAA